MKTEWRSHACRTDHSAGRAFDGAEAFYDDGDVPGAIRLEFREIEEKLLIEQEDKRKANDRAGEWKESQ